MTVSVVVPTFRRPRELGELLNALASQTRLPDEVIVVDAGASFQPGRSYLFPVIHLESSPNVCRQRNAGLRRATGDIVFYFDDDVVPAPDFIAVMLETFETHPEFIGGMGTLPPTTRRWSLGNLLCRVFLLQHEFGDGGFYGSGMPRHPYGTPGLLRTRVMGGGLCAVRRSRALESGTGFDEGMEHSQEDVDFALRFSRVGPLFHNPGALAQHRPAPAGRPGAAEAARRYMASYRYLYAKNIYPSSPWTLPLHWWAVAGMFVVAALTAPPAALSGYWAGLRAVPRP